jgi:hypothetical protein
MEWMLLVYVYMPLLGIAGIHGLARIPDGPHACDLSKAECRQWLR